MTELAQEKDEIWRIWSHRLAWLPLPLFILAAGVMYGMNTGVNFESPVLLATLNTLFCSSVSLLVAALSAREHRISGSLAALLLGCGALFFGLGDVLEALLLNRLGVAIVVHNTTMCLAGACFLASAGFALIRKPGNRRLNAMPGRLALSYLLVLALVAGLTVAASKGVMPDFYLVGRGSTFLRHLVVTLTVLEFWGAALGFGILYRKTSTPFLLWYCLGQGLIGWGLGLAIPVYHGSPLSWLGRSSQYVGGIYMLIAILTEVRGSRGMGLSLENAFRESEDRYRRLVAAMPTALYTCDRQGFITLYNDRAVELWGRRPQIGQERWHGASRLLRADGTALPPEQSSVALSLREGRPLRGAESMVERADGRRFHVLPQVELIYNAFGVVVGAVNILVDLTREVEARLQIETARAAAEIEKLRLEAVIDALPVGLSIVDARGSQVRTNSIYEQFRAGVPFQQGENPFAEEARILSAALNQGRVILRQKLDIQRPDGTVLSLLGNAAPIRDHEGKVAGAVLMEQDITDLRRAEVDLTRMNRILKATSASDSAMMRATTETEYLFEVCRVVVECGYTMVWIGYAKEDSEKTVWPVAYAGFDEGYLETQRIRWDDSEFGRGPTGTAIRTGKTCLCRNILTEPAFEPWREEALKRGYASTIAMPLRGGAKTFGALMIYSREPDPFTDDEIDLLSKLADDLAFGIDAIRLRQAQAQAEEAQRVSAMELARSNHDLEQFAYVTSHDLKEPLRMVTGFMTLLKDRYKGQLDAKGDDYIAYAVEATARMQQLIDDLLIYARVGRVGEMASVEVSDIVGSVLKNLRRVIEETGATITTDSLPVVRANPLDLIQVFQNLLGNALKFRGVAPPVIHIGVRQERDEWMFLIRDNGIGLEPQYADRIFMIFQRLHTTDDYPGTGVGLAICKKVVERCGGRIRVESKLGEGATFSFTIPVQIGAS